MKTVVQHVIRTVQHSSPSATAAPSSSSSKVACVALPNRTSASALPDNEDDSNGGDSNGGDSIGGDCSPPHCIHGPAIRFERGGVGHVFYACSVERDSKSGECGFRHDVAKEGEMTGAKVEKWKAREGFASFSRV